MRYAYYLPFEPAAAINYVYLIRLHTLAEYTEQHRLYDTIHYTTQEELAKRLKISGKTLSRLLANEAYKDYFTVNKEAKIITLHNNYRTSSATKNTQPFIRVEAAAIDKLLAAYEELNEPKTDLFIRYFLYIRYYCGKTGTNDFIQEQFLSAVGYATDTGTKNKLRIYNKVLQEQQLINLQYRRNAAGHKRILFSLPK